MTFPPLPIDEVLPALRDALATRNAAVLVAPPGAGKTTRVPLVLRDAPWIEGRKILVLEPRRLAARAAATQMARLLGERVGDTVGFRVRFGSQVSAKTRIEVVTEGIFTRMILDDPELTGIAAVLFDEFHERSLDTDLGLALARDAQSALRPDLRILPMSATLDAARVAALLDEAPVLRSEGRAFPVETFYVSRDARAGIERQMAETIARALRGQNGSVLAFLPGAGEIRQVERLLSDSALPEAVDVVPLYGALDAAVQDRAIAPSPEGRRKVVLATAIAETSLTIEGVRIVVDSGLARQPRYDVASGVTRLETVRVSRAAADQRRGRAGRLEPGVCYRLWDEPETQALPLYARPEILSADLAGFMLDLSAWGVADPAALSFLDPPPRAAVQEAQALLRAIHALDADNRITAMGKRLRGFPLPPRLARMIVAAGERGAAERAAAIAMLISERGLGGPDADLEARLERFAHDRSPRAQEARRSLGGWARLAKSGRTAEVSLSAGAILALAFPERVARNRGSGGQFLLVSGRGAAIDAASPLARAHYLAVGEITGGGASGRIMLAAPLAETEIEALFAEDIAERLVLQCDPATLAVQARRRRMLGAISLREVPVAATASAETRALLMDALATAGLDRLPWSDAAQTLRQRVEFLRGLDPQWPDLSDAGLLARRDDWLPALLEGRTAIAQISAAALSDALAAMIPWELRHRLDEWAPTHFAAPSGSSIPIRYEADGPRLAVRVQEMFGLDRHPMVAGGRVPLSLELLSPAHRPVQTTRDLPGFWRGSYAAVRSELRGRYPRHPWPDDPLAAPATRRAKPRGQ